MPPNTVIASRHHCDPGWSLGPFCHPIHEMLIILSGSHWACVDGGEFISGPGDVLLFHPGEFHEERIVGKESAEWLCLGFEHPAEIPDLPLRTHDRSGRARLLAEWVLTEVKRAQPGAERLAQNLLVCLLLELRESLAAPPAPMVEAIRRFVNEHLPERITLEGLARRCRLSKYHFTREYRRLSGLSPMTDVRRLRLERARELITTSDLPLKAIAPLTGLGDSAAFSRLFKKQFGLPPRALRHSRELAAPRG